MRVSAGAASVAMAGSVRGSLRPVGLLVAASLACASCAAANDAPVPLFTFGEGGYTCIRTPSVVRTASDTLLAFAGTRDTSGDGCYPRTRQSHGDATGTGTQTQDLVMKSSTDFGKTWSSIRSLYSSTSGARDHGAAVFDRVHNRVVVTFRDTKTWVITSDDDGTSWSAPRAVNLGSWSKSWVAPGRAIQLSASHPHAPNRLVFLNWNTINGQQTCLAYYSDDGGHTFTASTTPVVGGNEPVMVELTDGRLLMNVRVNKGVVGKGPGPRLFSFSSDGGETWSTPTLRKDLTANACEGSMLETGGLILYSHPAAMKTRSNGTIYASFNDGETWDAVLQLASEASTPFAYSCMTDMHRSGTVGIAYETQVAGCHGASCGIVFTKFVLP